MIVLCELIPVLYMFLSIHHIKGCLLLVCAVGFVLFGEWVPSIYACLPLTDALHHKHTAAYWKWKVNHKVGALSTAYHGFRDIYR